MNKESESTQSQKTGSRVTQTANRFTNPHIHTHKAYFYPPYMYAHMHARPRTHIPNREISMYPHQWLPARLKTLAILLSPDRSVSISHTQKTNKQQKQNRFTKQVQKTTQEISSKTKA